MLTYTWIAPGQWGHLAWDNKLIGQPGKISLTKLLILPYLQFPSNTAILTMASYQLGVRCQSLVLQTCSPDDSLLQFSHHKCSPSTKWNSDIC